MKLIVVSSSKNRTDEPKVMTEFFESGLNNYHLRKPSMSTREMASIIEAVPEHFHNRIVIHSHHKLAGTYGLKGIHLTGIHRKRKFSTWLRMRFLLMKNDALVVTTSFHKLGHVYTNKEPFSYVFLGSIFDRLSKKFHAGYNEHSIRAVVGKTDLPLIARGGTNADTILHCSDLGFSGIAFAGAIWDWPTPVDAWKNILDTCRHHSINVT
jgi:thiamine-phosphate pyrophosphorylase